MNGSFEVYTVWDGEPAASSLWYDILPQSIMGKSHNRLKRHTTVMDAGVEADETIDVRFIYIAYDSVCYTCDATTQACEKKSTPDHCWINSTCWAPGETKPNDPCRLCSPADSMTDWTMSDATEVCVNQTIREQEDADAAKKDMIVRGAVGGSISAIVILIVLIMFCVSRKKEKAAKAEEEEKLRKAEKNETLNHQNSLGKGYDNPLMRESHLYSEIRRNSSVGSNSLVGPRKTRVDVLKTEEGIKTDDGDNHSVNSASLRTSL